MDRGAQQNMLRTNETVECQSLCKNEDQDHAHEELWLLRICPAQQTVAVTQLAYGHCEYMNCEAGNISLLKSSYVPRKKVFG